MTLINFDRSIEESKLMATQHEAEMTALRERCVSLQKQVQKQHIEYEDLTQQMRQLVEAQWNTVNRLNPSQGISPQSQCRWKAKLAQDHFHLFVGLLFCQVREPAILPSHLMSLAFRITCLEQVVVPVPKHRPQQ